MGIKRLLLEMAVYGEAEVFAMNPVSTVLTEIVKNLEGDELRNYVSEEITSIPISNPLIQLTTSDIGIIIRHHCSGERPRKKAALLALPYVLNANYVTRPWRHKVDKDGKPLKGKDARQSGMISAPIMIDGVKYLCNITQKQNINGIIRPYALTLKDADGNIIEGEKMDCTFQVPDSNNEHTTFGNAHISKVTTSPDTNPSISANITKNNNTNENKTCNMKKNVQRINESQLRAIVAESVKKVLNEISLDTINNAARKAFQDATDISIKQGRDKIFGGNSVTNDDIKRLERRKRQGEAFNQELNRRMKEEGKQVYYIVQLAWGQPTGEIKEVYLTPQEAANYNGHGYIFDDYLKACRYAQS